MKRAGSYLLAAGLLWAAGGRAQDATSATAAAAAAATTPDTPYATIVARNMFALVPIPVVDPEANKPPVDPPPKITPNGIMTIFGKDQALYKVATKPKPGQPQKDDSYVLAEGEMQDDITVVKINHADGIITFNNHGTIQDLALVPAKDGGGGAGGGGPGPGNRGGGFGRPNAMGQQPGGGILPFQGRSLGSNPAFNPRGGNNNSPGNPNTPMSGPISLGGGTAASSSSAANSESGTPLDAQGRYAPAGNSGMTPEEAAILIEAQRAKYLQSGNKRMASILPPTPLTSQVIQENDASGGGDAPPPP